MDNTMLKTAAQVLGISEEEAKKTAKHLPELDAYLFCKPVIGGKAVIINANGEKLSGGSSIPPNRLKKLFLEGKRN